MGHTGVGATMTGAGWRWKFVPVDGIVHTHVCKAVAHDFGRARFLSSSLAFPFYLSAFSFSTARPASSLLLHCWPRETNLAEWSCFTATPCYAIVIQRTRKHAGNGVSGVLSIPEQPFRRLPFTLSQPFLANSNFLKPSPPKMRSIFLRSRPVDAIEFAECRS